MDRNRTGPLKRGYLAFVWGVPDRPKGTIDKPIGRHPRARPEDPLMWGSADMGIR